MGSVLVKVARDEDRYMVWSSVVDDVTWLFDDEEEARDYLESLHPLIEIRHQPEWVASQVADNLRRTKSTGTSGRSNASSQFRFNADPGDKIMYRQDGFIHRSSLPELFDIMAAAWSEPDEGENLVPELVAASGMLEPFERD